MFYSQMFITVKIVSLFWRENQTTSQIFCLVYEKQKRTCTTGLNILLKGFPEFLKTSRNRQKFITNNEQSVDYFTLFETPRFVFTSGKHFKNRVKKLE